MAGRTASCTSSVSGMSGCHSEDSKARLRLCYGGIFKQVPDMSYKYVGGESFNESIAVPCKYAEFMFKLSEKFKTAVSIKYQAPGEELDPDALITVQDDDDLQELVEEYLEHLTRPGTPSKTFRIRLFAFPATEEPLTPDEIMEGENFFGVSPHPVTRLRQGSHGGLEGRSSWGSNLSSSSTPCATRHPTFGGDVDAAWLSNMAGIAGAASGSGGHDALQQALHRHQQRAQLPLLLPAPPHLSGSHLDLLHLHGELGVREGSGTGAAGAHGSGAANGHGLYPLQQQQPPHNHHARSSSGYGSRLSGGAGGAGSNSGALPPFDSALEQQAFERIKLGVNSHQPPGLDRWGPPGVGRSFGNTPSPGAASGSASFAGAGGRLALDNSSVAAPASELDAFYSQQEESEVMDASEVDLDFYEQQRAARAGTAAAAAASDRALPLGAEHTSGQLFCDCEVGEEEEADGCLVGSCGGAISTDDEQLQEVLEAVEAEGLKRDTRLQLQQQDAQEQQRRLALLAQHKGAVRQGQGSEEQQQEDLERQPHLPADPWDMTPGHSGTGLAPPTVSAQRLPSHISAFGDSLDGAVSAAVLLLGSTPDADAQAQPPQHKELEHADAVVSALPSHISAFGDTLDEAAQQAAEVGVLRALQSSGGGGGSQRGDSTSPDLGNGSKPTSGRGRNRGLGPLTQDSGFSLDGYCPKGVAAAAAAAAAAVDSRPGSGEASAPDPASGAVRGGRHAQALAPDQQGQHRPPGLALPPERCGSGDSGSLPSMPHIKSIHRVARGEVRVAHKIGEGAFGEVVLAVAPLYGTVAIKWLKSERFSKHSQSFWREAGMLSELNHPNVLRFYGVVTESHAPESIVIGIMTEYVAGGSLAQLLRAVRGPLPLSVRCELALGAANGLAYLHELSVVHFDLKPDNLLLDGPPPADVLRPHNARNVRRRRPQPLPAPLQQQAVQQAGQHGQQLRQHLGVAHSGGGGAAAEESSVSGSGSQGSAHSAVSSGGGLLATASAMVGNGHHLRPQVHHLQQQQQQQQQQQHHPYSGPTDADAADAADALLMGLSPPTPCAMPAAPPAAAIAAARSAPPALTYSDPHAASAAAANEAALAAAAAAALARWAPGAVKVADFGLSKHKLNNYVSSCRDLRGTLPYMAPELVADPERVCEKADVWSLGVVMWEMLTRELPYADLAPQQVLLGLMCGNLSLPVPEDCEPEWRGLLEAALEPNPGARPSMRELAAQLEAIRDQQRAQQQQPHHQHQ